MSGTTPEEPGRDEAGPDETGRDETGPDEAGPDEAGLASRVADFWGGAVPMAPDAPLVPDPAIARLGVPDMAIRGRNPADLVRPVYDALTSR
ncbi:hypothetical protein OG216_06660 [Streptomycetaceae bacterium NBC_01309]